MHVEVTLWTRVLRWPVSVLLTFERRTCVLCATNHPMMINICTKLFCSRSKNKQDTVLTKTFNSFYLTFCDIDLHFVIGLLTPKCDLDLYHRHLDYFTWQPTSLWKTFAPSYIKIYNAGGSSPPDTGFALIPKCAFELWPADLVWYVLHTIPSWWTFEPNYFVIL
jgi:hypothetical protein